MSSPPNEATSSPLQELSFGDYERFSQLLLSYCGLDFTERRRAELSLGVCHAFATSTCRSLDEYFSLLQDPVAGRMDLDRLVNAVTVNESHFFRDAAQFDALCYHVLPQLIERKRSLRTLRIWSAGCASGEEPYSIAILLRELLPDIGDWAITILGTDINTAALSRARKGIYGDWAFREERAKTWRSVHFRSAGNRYELRPEVRRMVTFGWLNLAEPTYPAYETNTMLMDLILCRNVTIYFGAPVTQQVVDRFYDGLLDGGWLVVGHSEPSLFTYRRFQAHNFPDTVLYRRTGEPTILPQDWSMLDTSSFAPSSDPCPPSVVREVEGSTLPLESVKEDGVPVMGDAASGVASLDQIYELMEYGYSERARDQLLALVQIQPDARVHTLLGRVYANLGQWEEAARWCREALRMDNLLLDAYYTLALVLQHQADLPQAIDALKKVIYIDRAHVLGHFGLANLYHATGQLAHACKSLDNAYRLLERYRDDQLIADSGGITAVRLKETIVRQQQQWGGEGGRLLLNPRSGSQEDGNGTH